MEKTAIESAQDYGFVRDGKVYRKSFRDYPEKEIGLVKETEEAALEYFFKRFQFIRDKVLQLLDEMENAENKGSYLNKIIHEKESLPHANVLGDIGPLIDLLQEKEDQLKDSIQNNRARNTEYKLGILEELESMRDYTDYKDRAEKLRNIRASWIKTGPVAPEKLEEIETRYTEIMNYFHDQRREYLELRDALISSRLATLDSILERQQELGAPDTHPGHVIKTLQQLTKEWRDAGNVPKEEYTPRMEAFKAKKQDLINEAKKAFKAKPPRPNTRPLTPQEIEENKNFDIKQTMLDQAKEVLNKGDFRGAYQKVKEMQAAWHNVGPISKQKQFINKEFTYVCDRISEFSFLNKMLYQSNPYYFRLPPKELNSAKLTIMKEIIRKEESDIENFGQQLPPYQHGVQEAPEIKALRGRVNSQNRRLAVKNEILNELRAEQANLH